MNKNISYFPGIFFNFYFIFTVVLAQYMMLKVNMIKLWNTMRKIC